jgi:hypothetical protein
VICAYKGTTELSDVSTSEVQVNLVYSGKYSHPNCRVFQQYRPVAGIQQKQKPHTAAGLQIQSDCFLKVTGAHPDIIALDN